MSDNSFDLNTHIRALVAEILELDDPAALNDSDHLRDDLGMDSLGSLELLSRLSEELKLDLEMEDAMDISTIADACSFIGRNMQEQNKTAPAPAAETTA